MGASMGASMGSTMGSTMRVRLHGAAALCAAPSSDLDHGLDDLLDASADARGIFVAVRAEVEELAMPDGAVFDERARLGEVPVDVSLDSSGASVYYKELDVVAPAVVLR